MARRAAVVGMGAMGELHAQEYLHMQDVTLVGIVETDLGKHDALKRRYRAPVFTTFEPLVGETDLVSVCTPDHLHVEPAVAFLEAGARVLVEKPLAMTLNDGQRILDAARSADDLSVGHILRFDPRVIRCRELIQSGAIGEVVEIQVWRKTTREMGRPASQRTSVAWFLGIHDADLVRHVTGLHAVEVAAIGRSVVSDHLDVTYAQVRYSNGAIGTMDNGWILPAGRANRALAGLRVVGSQASVEVDLGHVDLLLSTDANCLNLDTRFWPGETATGYSNVRGELRAFADGRDDKAPPLASGQDGLIAVGVIEALHRSVASGGAPQRADVTRTAPGSRD